MAEVGEDDRQETLKDILDLRQSSVMSELLAIEQHAEPVDKAHKWARDLLCLRYQAFPDHCFRETHNYALKRSFVAVSYHGPGDDLQEKAQSRANTLWYPYVNTDVERLPCTATRLIYGTVCLIES
jgi:hypothetical protein